MALKAEQVMSKSQKSYNKRLSDKQVKKDTHRKARRLAKADPENAPTKRPIRGYCG